VIDPTANQPGPAASQAGWPASSPGAPPPPPAPPTVTSAEALRLALSEQQLAEARLRLSEMEELLRDLPEIFERKFQQRLQPLLERQDRLLEDNQHLRQQMRQLTATNAEMRQLPPAAPTEALQLPTLPDKPPKRWSFLGNRSDSNRAA
jgi:hypothetical protein